MVVNSSGLWLLLLLLLLCGRGSYELHLRRCRWAFQIDKQYLLAEHSRLVKFGLLKDGILTWRAARCWAVCAQLLPRVPREAHTCRAVRMASLCAMWIAFSMISISVSVLCVCVGGSFGIPCCICRSWVCLFLTPSRAWFRSWKLRYSRLCINVWVTCVIAFVGGPMTHYLPCAFVYAPPRLHIAVALQFCQQLIGFAITIHVHMQLQFVMQVFSMVEVGKRYR